MQHMYHKGPFPFCASKDFCYPIGRKWSKCKGLDVAEVLTSFSTNRTRALRWKWKPAFIGFCNFAKFSYYFTKCSYFFANCSYYFAKCSYYFTNCSYYFANCSYYFCKLFAFLKKIFRSCLQLWATVHKECKQMVPAWKTKKYWILYGYCFDKIIDYQISWKE